MMRRWDCLCAGIVVADLVCEPVEAMPPAGGLALTPGVKLTIGGCAANAGVDMATLGLRVRLSGCVGDDLFGRAMHDMLSRSAIDCGGLTVCPNVSTSTTCVVNVRGEDRRFIHCIGSNALYDGTQITDDDLQSARVLYLGGYCLLPGLTPQRVSMLFQRAKQSGVLTLLNVVLPQEGEFRDWIAPLMPLTDLFVLNNDEAARIVGTRDCREQAATFRRGGCGTVVITRGGEGSLCVSAEGAWEAGVHAVKAVDATGTGDAFVAGYVYGTLQGCNAPTCLRYGSAMGANCVQSVGATTGALTAVQLEEFVERHPLPIRTAETQG